MTDTTRLDVDAGIRRGAIPDGTAPLTGPVAAPGRSAADQRREGLGEVRAPPAKAGTGEGRIPHVQMWLDDVRDFDEVNAAWDAWVPKEQAPARPSGRGRMAKPGMSVELIVAAAL